VQVTKNDTLKKEGKLLETTEDGVCRNRRRKGKKKEIKQETVLFTDIKTTKIQVKF
jgi:ribosome maturation factor RimP